MVKKALITGITGQDGSYLAELLLEKGYHVHGILRRSSISKTSRIQHLITNEKSASKIELHYADLSDANSLMKILYDIAPHEIYHLGAQSDVAVSFKIPIFTADVSGVATLRLLESVRQLGLKSRFYQAGTSELFGDALETPQNENTPFNPRSPYGTAKAFAHWTTKCYRESYKIFSANGILFNHESPRRGENFVTRKISKAVARIKLGLQPSLEIGNLEAKRDWGYAKDYVEGMWRILQHDEADDFVLATGETHTVREFLEEAFGLVDLEWQEYVKVDEKYFRPLEVPALIGDPAKARKILNWESKVKFKELVKIMVEADLENEKRKLHERAV